MRAISLGILFMWIVSCGKSNYIVNHDLPTRPVSSPFRQVSKACAQANAQVSQAVTALNLSNVNSNQAEVLPDGSCAVVVTMNDHTKAPALIAALKTKTGGLDSFVQTSTVLVPLWFDEYHQPINGHQKAGARFDSGVTATHCQGAGNELQAAFPVAAVSVQPNRGGSATFTGNCYVQASFPKNSDFETFLGWTNPLSSNHDPYHIDVNGVTVWIRAFSAQVTP